MNTTGLKPFQVDHAPRILRALLANLAALDASDTGTGKTFVACAIARHLAMIPLVICPLSTVPAWERAGEAMGCPVEVVNYEKVRGVRKVALLKQDLVHKLTGKPFHGPLTCRLSRSDWGQEIKAGKGSRWEWNRSYEFMIFDEVHRCGGMTSLNSKLLVAARRQAQYVLALSATAASDPRELKALGYALRLFELRGFKWWLLKHGCKPGVFGGFDRSADPAEQQRAMLAINKQLFPGRGARMEKDKIAGFPKTIIACRLISDPTGKAAALSERAAGEWQNLLCYDEVHRPNHLAALTALRQKLELLRVDQLVEMAEDFSSTSRVAIFVNYTRTLDLLREKLSRIFHQDIPTIDGTNTPAEREEAIWAFQSNSSPVIVVNNQAGGTGVNLHDPTGQVERTSLISPCYRVPDMMQVLGRVQRADGAFSQQYFVYFAGTREEEIARVIGEGFDNLAALNDAALNGVFHYDEKKRAADNRKNQTRGRAQSLLAPAGKLFPTAGAR